jgi:magnesium transporter
MLNVFTLSNGRLFQEEIESLEELSRFRPIWVDLEEPTPEEQRWVKQYYGLSIPEDAMNEQLRSHGVLFSIHDETVPAFRLLRMRARRMPGLLTDAKEVLLKLFDADAEYCADTLEGIYDDLEMTSKKVLEGNVGDEVAGEVLAAIARQEDMNGRIRRNVMDTRRAVSFLMRSKMLGAEQFEEARQILRDIDSLDSHTAFLFEKINFLMDATVGFININQNRIIKLFSVASVALLPPTLVASIYGMNFRHMPELNQSWGYPYAIALMVASALLPMWYFRRRGWLK